MRLLLDQGVPRRAAALLREAGVDALHVADFHASIALSGGTAPSAIRLRVQGLKGPEVARLLLDILSNREAQLAAGALVTVQHGRLRLRVLPIARKPQ